MTEILKSYTIETPGGTFIIYPGELAEDSDSHEPLHWYYAPNGWKGKPYSKAYYSSESAEEACWESLRKPDSA
jgi:hypothetical protein